MENLARRDNKLSTGRRLLGIDHGTTVIGVAICDPGGQIARPLRLITRTTRVGDFTAIESLVREFQIEGIVVGLPNVAPAFTGESQAPTVQRWAARLAGTITVPVYLWDETLSTEEAHSLSRQMRRSPDARVDDLAAAIILQSFLDNHPPGDPFPSPVPPGRHAAPLPPS